MKTKNLFLTGALLSPLCCLAADTKSTAVTQPSSPETWIAFLPVIFFALILIVVIFKLKKGGVGLSDLLAEKDLQAPAAAAPAAPAPAVGAATGNPPQSVSRFVVFLTGLVALIIGVCLSTFFMYCYFKDSTKTVDLSNLTTVVWGLGIGVIPYGANKLSSAIKSNP